ncbi:MAG: MGMT family protein [Methanoregula sp.]|nr:MGMT family protein [Methanoregula sp.]
MEIIGGSCRFGLWFVHVWWNDTTVHQVRFATTGIPGEVPSLIRQYCAGQVVSPEKLDSVATHEDTVYSRIYRVVQQIPYGSTTSYGEIADITRTSPRVVGQAMARNPTPLVIPCHRVLAAHGIGGFSPDVAIKESLLVMEKKALRKVER